MKLNVNDKVRIDKIGDKFNNEIGTIVHIYEFNYSPITSYKVKFENGKTKEYFYIELIKVR